MGLVNAYGKNQRQSRPDLFKRHWLGVPWIYEFGNLVSSVLCGWSIFRSIILALQYAGSLDFQSCYCSKFTVVGAIRRSIMGICCWHWSNAWSANVARNKRLHGWSNLFLLWKQKEARRYVKRKWWLQASMIRLEFLFSFAHSNLTNCVANQSFI